MQGTFFIHERDKDRNEIDLLSKIIEKMIIIEDVRKEILETEASEAGWEPIYKTTGKYLCSRVTPPIITLF